MYLVADIGGTKTRVGFVEDISKQLPGGLCPEPVFCSIREYPSKKFGSFEDILQLFLREIPVTPKVIALGIAGPVSGAQVKTTNLPWIIDAKRISASMRGASIILLNDLEALGYGLSLCRSDVNKGRVIIQQGHPEHGNAAVVAVGTGLGESILFWDGSKHIPRPSEGGHADFGPQDEEQIELARYLLKKYSPVGHVSWERVLSGQFGFINIYSFLRDEGFVPSSLLLDQAAKDQREEFGALVAKEAENKSPIAQKTMALFARLYGAEAGNLALKAFAVNGIFLGGGVTPRILPWLQTGEFLKAFSAKGRQRALLEKIPIHVIIDRDIALKGLALFAATHALHKK